MSIIQFPDGLQMTKQTWGQKRNDLSFSSMFGSQSIEISPPVWEMSLSPPPYLKTESGIFESLMMNLRGKENQLACHNMRRPAPLGTMRGTMVFAANAAKGAMSINVWATGQAGKTLLAGDFIGFGTGTSQQVVMVTANATANSTGVITLTVEPPLRNAFASGASVVWNKPKAIFRRTESGTSWDYEMNLVNIDAVSFTEDWR